MEQSENVTFKWENKVRSESRENTFKQKQHEKSKEWMTNPIKQEKIQNAQTTLLTDWLIKQKEENKKGNRERKKQTN
jgi:hypothetical protein